MKKDRILKLIAGAFVLVMIIVAVFLWRNNVILSELPGNLIMGLLVSNNKPDTTVLNEYTSPDWTKKIAIESDLNYEVYLMSIDQSTGAGRYVRHFKSYTGADIFWVDNSTVCVMPNDLAVSVLEDECSDSYTVLIEI